MPWDYGLGLPKGSMYYMVLLIILCEGAIFRGKDMPGHELCRNGRTDKMLFALWTRVWAEQSM